MDPPYFDMYIILFGYEFFLYNVECMFSFYCFCIFSMHGFLDCTIVLKWFIIYLEKYKFEKL